MEFKVKEVHLNGYVEIEVECWEGSGAAGKCLLVSELIDWRREKNLSKIHVYIK